MKNIWVIEETGPNGMSRVLATSAQQAEELKKLSEKFWDELHDKNLAPKRTYKINRYKLDEYNSNEKSVGLVRDEPHQGVY